MRFGPVALADAEGAILAHSDGRARRIAKGTRLTAAHLGALAADGIETVVVARLEPGDVPEDAAALELARALVDGREGLVIAPAQGGRVNLKAAGPGLLDVDAAAVHALNAISPDLTLATVPPLARLSAGALACTIKVIPFAARRGDLHRAVAAASGAVGLRAPVIGTAELIETQTHGSEPSSEKGRRSMQARLERLGVSLGRRRVVPHAPDDLARALAEAEGELLLVLTATATSDIRDTAPDALRRAGGEVVHYGMPVDPGNLLFLGRLDGRPVIGLPGCARSPALNGADWIVERIVCGVPVVGEDIARMGVGGLLKEIPERGRLRDGD